jgi:hypothetical protein
MQKGQAMELKKMPTNVWMVVDIAYNAWNVVSTHGSQRDAETERDRRNKGSGKAALQRLHRTQADRRGRPTLPRLKSAGSAARPSSACVLSLLRQPELA